MNLEGIFIMITSITMVSGLAGFCVYKILKGHGK